MGMVFGEVTFQERGPTVERLAAKITELSGLPVTVTPPGPGDLEIHDQHAYLAFTAAPEEQLEIVSYKPGAAKKYYHDFMEGFEDLPIAKHAVGLNEVPGTQVVYLRSFIGHEPTLMMTALLALEALGGRPQEPFTDEERREFGTTISEKELGQRRQKLQGQFKRAAWLWVLLLPITIPLFFLQLLLFLVLMPWRLWKAAQEVKKFEDKQKHKKFMVSIATSFEFLPTTPEEYPDLDRSALRYYTHAFEALGFVHALDYRVETDGPRVGHGFARLFFHPTELCLVEVNQVFSRKNGPREMRCMVASILDDDWSLSTTDRTLSPLSYAWRRPRSLWSVHPHLKPVELFDEHLRRRQQMMDRLHIGVKSIQTTDAYFEYEQHIHAARRAILKSKTYAEIKAEVTQCKAAPPSEWLGDFAGH